MAEMHEYRSTADVSPFGRWFAGLDRVAAAKVTMAIVRLAGGNTGKVKTLGPGLAEIKVDFGPGYRVYLGWDGPDRMILLGGGTKKRQNKDIAAARERWRDFQIRRRGDSCH